MCACVKWRQMVGRECYCVCVCVCVRARVCEREKVLACTRVKVSNI